jgi:hypothetical protein
MILDSSLGRRNFFLGRRLATPVLNWWLILNFHYFYFSSGWWCGPDMGWLQGEYPDKSRFFNPLSSRSR